jgi:hypothetical protein
VGAFADLSDANLHRAAAADATDREKIDPEETEVVELHRCHLSDSDWRFRTGANLMRRLTAPMRWQLKKPTTAKAPFADRGGHVDVELGCNVSCDCAHRRLLRP